MAIRTRVGTRNRPSVECGNERVRKPRPHAERTGSRDDLTGKRPKPGRVEICDGLPAKLRILRVVEKRARPRRSRRANESQPILCKEPVPVRRPAKPAGAEAHHVVSVVVETAGAHALVVRDD